MVMPILPGGTVPFPPSRKTGLFGSSTRMQMARPGFVAQPPVVPDDAPPRQQGGRNWIGILADALSGLAGGPANYANQQFQQRQIADARAYADQQYERSRTDDQAEWQRKEQWKRDHPAPVVNDTVNDFNWFKGLSPEDRALYQNMRPEYRQGPDGQFYRVNPVAPPSFTQDDWDAAPAMGGQTSPASVGFP